jgi:hypothetical protein
MFSSSSGSQFNHDFAVELGEAGIREVQTPYPAPNANAVAERFVRSIKAECLDQLIPLGEHHVQQALREHFGA